VWIPRQPKRLWQRLVYEISFFLSLLRSVCYGRRFDVQLVVCPLFGGVLFALLRKLIWREPILLNIQDIPSDAAAAAELTRSASLHRIFKWIESRVFERAEAICTISDAMVVRLKSELPPSSEVHLCPNWLVGPIATRIRDKADDKEKPNGHPLRLLYCGNIGGKQGLLDFCQWIRSTDIPFHFEIRGQGAEFPDLARWDERSGDSRFTVGELLSVDRFVDAIRTADFFVITEKAAAGFAFIPSKLIPSISLGTPILAVCGEQSALGAEVMSHRLGLRYSWNELDKLELILSDIKTNSSGIPEMRDNCQKRSVNYARDQNVTHLENVLRRIGCEIG